MRVRCSLCATAGPTVSQASDQPTVVQQPPTRQGRTLLWLATGASAKPPEPAPFVSAAVLGSGGSGNSLRSRSSATSPIAFTAACPAPLRPCASSANTCSGVTSRPSPGQEWVTKSECRPFRIMLQGKVLHMR